MSSMMTLEMGVSLRQLQVLTVLWLAARPLPRRELHRRLNDRSAQPIQDVTLRTLIRKLDAKEMLRRDVEPHKSGTIGRTRILYSANVTPEAVIANLMETLFGQIFQDHPVFLDIALRQVRRRLADANSRSAGLHPSARATASNPQPGPSAG